VTWLLPELEVGEEPEPRPPELELDEEPEFVELEPEELDPEELEPAEPEPAEPEPAEPELVPDEPEPELAEDEFDEPVEVELDPVEDDAVLCADPGRARASAPAVTTLAMATVVVVDRTLFLPRSLAAMAWRIPSSRRALLMYLILRSRTRKSLHEPSGSAMNRGSPRCCGRGYPANMKDT
jgi:hypothetical protein